MPFFDEMFKNGLNLEKFSHGKSQRPSTIDMLALSQKMIDVQLNYKHNISRKKLATQHLLRLNGSIRYMEWEIESSYTAHEENSTSFVQFDNLVASILRSRCNQFDIVYYDQWNWDLRPPELPVAINHSSVLRRWMGHPSNSDRRMEEKNCDK